MFNFVLSQRSQDVIITSSLRQNDVPTSLGRNDDVIITSCVRLEDILGLRPANEKQRYFATTSLIGWAQT